MKRKSICALMLICVMLAATPVTVGAEDGTDGEVTAQVTINGEPNMISDESLAAGSSPENEEAVFADSTAQASDGEGGSGSISQGGLAAGTAYELTPELLEYDSTYVLTRQFPSKAQNGVYFLQGNMLLFLDLSTGQYSTVYTFDSYYGSVYSTGSMLYWAYGDTIIKYDLDSQKVAETLIIEEMNWSDGIGVDNSGRIYMYGSYGDFEEERLLLFNPQGELLDSRTVPDEIYDFCGFASDGTFYYIGYYNYIYWGYEHDMDALFAGQVVNGKFSDEKIIRLENVGQQYFSEHQDYAALLSDTVLADYMGNVFDVSNIQNLEMDTLLTIERETDEELSKYGDLSSIGTRMLYDGATDSVLAYSSGRNLFRYNLSSGEVVERYTTKHYVFNLLDYGDQIIAIEREEDGFYIEVINKTDLKKVETVNIDLNATETYSSHSKETVEEKYESAKIADDIQVYESQYSLSPYKEAVLTDEMKGALLDYSNFLRWLGGLTPFESAPEEMWSSGGKGTVLLTKLKKMTHDPERPDDMDTGFYEDAHAACSGSNLYGGGVSENNSDRFMYYINGWLNDTANVSTLELGHRFEFLQREGYQISYGATDRYLSQKVELYGGQLNTTGTVKGVDNNDYCYTWPSAGYFPAEVINTSALWSFNLNSDKIRLSNKAMKVEIKDLDTGEVTDVSDTIGSSAYYGMSSYFGFFKGMHFYFAPPGADSYAGKHYEVKISNLELADGNPANMIYTVNFFNPYVKGDADLSGEVDISDLRLVLRHVCGKISLTEDQKNAADVETDGVVNINDLRKILRFVCRKLDTLE